MGLFLSNLGPTPCQCLNNSVSFSMDLLMITASIFVQGVISYGVLPWREMVCNADDEQYTWYSCMCTMLKYNQLHTLYTAYHALWA